MLISLNWIRDFVDLPADLDMHALAERFTMTTAEVEGVEEIRLNARGLIAAKVLSVEPVADKPGLNAVVLEAGTQNGQPLKVDTVSAAPDLEEGDIVVYAPPGAYLEGSGEITATSVAGRTSCGMIVSGEMVGIALAANQAVFLPPDAEPGSPLDPTLFDDWVMEVDNKSITHRPDLWGHYGIAREIAAIFQTPLKPYPVVDIESLQNDDLPEIPIEIDDPEACPRYSGLRMEGVSSQAAPLWMQMRLGHVGMRPIDCLVDLTNYIMAELGQPMHAFDGGKLERIEVGNAPEGSSFTTLDGMERKLPDHALMINCNRETVALAGIMGGLATEVAPHTKSILLESANFHPAVVRRCAMKLGLRTDASTRFEKSLDPHNTVLAIQRFVHLARAEFPELKMTSRLSDCFPKPAEKISVRIDPEFVNRYMGQPTPRERMKEILTALEFVVADEGDGMRVEVPSFRATKDISIEADVIEEISRCVGYDNIEPRLPEATLRCFAANPLHRLEQDTLRLMCQGLGFNEIHGYLWYDDVWTEKMGFVPGPCVEVRNAITAHERLLRHTLMPGMLKAADLNRHHFDGFRLLELGSVYPPGTDADKEYRHLGLVVAQRSKKAEDQLVMELKGVLETWALQVLNRPCSYRRMEGDQRQLWEHPAKTAAVMIDGKQIGSIGVVPLDLRQKMDEHLGAWSIAWAEVKLDELAELDEVVLKLPPIPPHPRNDLDFSVLTEAGREYAAVIEEVGKFDHPLLVAVNFVGSYEGKSIPAGKRSLTFTTRIGDPDRTLTEEDLNEFRAAFESHLDRCGLELRRG